MHRLIKDRLEDFLASAPETQVPSECEHHLKVCENCREELNLMQEQASLLQVLRTGREIEPLPGFYARVMERVEAQQRSSIWSVFLEPAFGRRLAVASLALSLLLGGYLALSESQTVEAPGADAIIAVQQHPPDLGQNQQRDRDITLVTLATYKE